jgi:hypothetical protein
MSQSSPIATDPSRTSPPSRPPIFHSPGRTLLGLILIFGAYTKLHFNGAWHFRDYHFFFAMAIGTYRSLPFGAVEWLARVLPWRCRHALGIVSYLCAVVVHGVSAARRDPGPR